MQRLRILLALVIFTLSVAPAWAQKPIDRETALERAADPERWAAVKGTMQNDGSFLAKEIELIALGDAEGMEVMEIRGVLSSLNVNERSMRVLNYPVIWNEDARLRDADKNKIAATELKNGVGATVEGHFKDGTFWAEDIRLRSGKMKEGKLTYKQEIIGPVRVVDAESGLLRVIETDVRMRPNAKCFELPMQVKSAGK